MKALSLQGQAPAIRVSRAIRTSSVRSLCVRTLALARRKSLTLAGICTVALYAGLLLGSDPITYTSAAIALGFVCLDESTQKGGKQ